MQTLTWSPNLRYMVKKLKSTLSHNPEGLLADKDFTSSLSPSEEILMVATFKTVNREDPDGIWS
ncbi:hypothetical protein EHS13_14570 [Paenibacillus psychroresistens]|uniref:Uncharacterized protein n=1 Tax=Paenibacillus psychroresistens TaxID=1778678 RepID=A0A6B8RKD4_9BACL|nr:hypothetical protein [Paenibacillus psychroresistens]QGQ96013.1 hypothetical protein EHS13_14570 [Paenibacillus psychroresistens]